MTKDQGLAYLSSVALSALACQWMEVRGRGEPYSPEILVLVYSAVSRELKSCVTPNFRAFPAKNQEIGPEYR